MKKNKSTYIYNYSSSNGGVVQYYGVCGRREVANAVNSNTWTKARGQIKSIVNDVVFP